MKIKEGFILHEISGQTVVLPTGNELNLNMMITLNGTGKFLWERMQEETDEAALVEALLGAYDVDRETATECVSNFVAGLKDNDFLA